MILVILTVVCYRRRRCCGCCCCCCCYHSKEDKGGWLAPSLLPVSVPPFTIKVYGSVPQSLSRYPACHRGPRGSFSAAGKKPAHAKILFELACPQYGMFPYELIHNL